MDAGNGMLRALIVEDSPDVPYPSYRKRFEAALLASEREFRSLAENLPDMVMRYGRDFQCTYVNPAYVRETGMSVKVALRLSLDAQLCDKFGMSEAECRSWRQQVIESGESKERVASLQRVPENATVHFALRMVAERDAEGHIFGILVIGRNITDMLESKRRLEKSRTQLRMLAIHRESAREEERLHLARELHDELGQHLTVLRIGISLLKPQYGGLLPEAEETDDLLSLVDQTIQIVRNISSSLRPVALDLGIVAALRWLTTEFSRHTGIICDLKAPQTDVPIAKEHAIILFRIAQESMTNAARHGKTELIQIVFEYGPEGYVLEIRDNGVGFDTTDQCKHQSYGLVGIRERALAVGGEVDIFSAPGQGTTVRVRIPADNKLVRKFLRKD